MSPTGPDDAVVSDAPSRPQRESAFDEARSLLQSALDEVRPSAPTVEEPHARPASRPRRSTSPRPSRRRRGAGSPAATGGAQGAGGGAPADQASHEGGELDREATGQPVWRRRTRRRPEPAMTIAVPELTLRSSPPVLDPADEPTIVMDAPAAAATPVPGTDEPDLAARGWAGPDAAPPGAGHDSRRRVGVAVAVGALLALVVGLIVVLVSSGGSDESPTAAPAPQAVRLGFKPVTTSDGVVVRRGWTLTGARGSELGGTLVFSNPTSAPVTTSYTEVIPKSLARSADDIRFDPQPTVLKADPVVQYTVTVPANGQMTATYHVKVRSAGLRRARLRAWADAAAREATTSTSSTSTTTPTTVAAPPTTVAEAPVTTAAAPPPPSPPPPPPPPTTRGAVVVRVVSNGGSGATFGFSGAGGSAALTTSGGPNGSAQSATISVPTGNVSWSQVSTPPGWVLVGVSCSNGAGGGATASFELHEGETVTCTWTNSR
jgi:hypothetical protein